MTDFAEESEIDVPVSAFTQSVSLTFSKMYCTVEGRITFQQEATHRELRKRQHLACAIAEEGRRRTIAEEQHRRAKRMRTDVRVYMKKEHVHMKDPYADEEKMYAMEYANAHVKMEKELAEMEKELSDEALAKEYANEYANARANEYANARAKMEKELAKVKKAEEALAKEEEKERAKAKKAEERAKAKKAEERAKALAKALAKERIDHDRESAKMCMRMKREESKRIPNSLSDDDMMTAVLQSLGHPSMIGVDLLLSIYTLWLFRATKYHRNGRLMNRLALMKSFAVEYFSIARHK